MAASRKHKSIAFPAIGTGALGFTKEEAAQLMCDAVANFAQNFPEKMEVYFVIFPADNDTFQVVFFFLICQDFNISLSVMFSNKHV